jgi:hypothetical protein
LIHEAPVVADIPPPDPADPAANPATDPTKAAQPPKRRKPKPPPPVAADPGAPLDLGTIPSGRNPPSRRFFPADAAPIPPANVGR